MLLPAYQSIAASCTHAERRAACVQLVDEFVRAIFGRFPHTVLQFEVRLHNPLLAFISQVLNVNRISVSVHAHTHR